jgi:hypothetical protein
MKLAGLGFVWLPLAAAALLKLAARMGRLADTFQTLNALVFVKL